MTKRNTKAGSQIDLDFSFFSYLRQFYKDKKGTIRNYYKDLSKKFLDFNDPVNPNSFLRNPQFEALEMYIFLKEYLGNSPLHHIFDDWYHKNDRFQSREDAGLEGEQLDLFGVINDEQYKAVFSRMRQNTQLYPNYIFALTMGTGKTILMATCIFYEFLLSKKFPKDTRFCHNALVFAPDRTVLESLKEIYTFDKALVVPPEYVNFLNSHLQIHFLEEAGTTLNTLDRSMFNLIISNSQKIILKRQHTTKSAVDRLFTKSPVFESQSVYDDASDLYDFDTPEDEVDLTINQRFQKLTRLGQLGIFVDEAHHSFGDQLAKNMGIKKANNSLRLTINELATSLERSGTRVVACYNFTGTPYVGKEILPEVVYSYGLKEAINKEYLKKVDLHGYSNTKSSEFVKISITDFWMKYGENRYEGKLPKLAFFASSIEELRDELQPAVEKALIELDIPIEKILRNVGDDKLTTSDDIREFNSLDRPSSKKQFILLVNKGREGWNCRSLFGVALFRSPRSKVFVLQATMRCMRAIGEVQETASVYLSTQNYEILDDELQQNFRLGTGDIGGAVSDKKKCEIRLVPPPVKITLKRIHKLHHLKEKAPRKGICLELDKADLEKYKIIHTTKHGLDFDENSKIKVIEEDITALREKREFSVLTLTGEIARYLNRSCIEIEEILESTNESLNLILKVVNQYNEVLYDWIIPRLFKEFFDLKSYESTEEEEIDLVKNPVNGYYAVSAKPDLIMERTEPLIAKYVDKSFHVDTYCFDSAPEKRLFSDLIRCKDVKKIYFTGMLTHGQSDFYVQYIDPESHTVRRYYPDFLVEKEDGSWLMIEVKGDNKIDDPIVLAKAEYASQIAVVNRMKYKVIKGSDAKAGRYQEVLN